MDAALPVKPKKGKRPAWKRSVWKQLWIDKTTYAMIAPFMLGFLVFQVAAVFIAMGMSFTDYNIFTPPSFVGLSNYISMFLNDDIFVTALQNTLLLAFVTGPLSFVACFMFAWLINELPRRIRSVLTVLLYAPTLSQLNFLSFVIVFGGMRYAYVNSFLLRLGIIDKPIQFFNDPKYMMGVVIIVTICMSLGVSFLAFIAGLKTVDPQLYEAASIDGIKNRFQELIYVTLPNMKPQL
ncbi:MAG: sugar ABC transporter permease, partial [Defluviitaleaceae bacterium]|nr:sugar ABC transporter permease [Defluviitaleaceae bacterium]